MKKYKIMFWIPTVIIFIMEGVLPALTSQSEMAVQGITHLGYPVYFGTMLAVFKVLGSLSLIIPQIPRRIKEWAYAGFAIDFISAFVSIAVVDGLGAGSLMPLVFIVILIISYIGYQKMNQGQVV